MNGKWWGLSVFVEEVNLQKIAVYLPDHFLNTVESIAQDNLQPTSVWIRQVLVDYVRLHDYRNKENVNKDASAEKRETDQWLAKSNRLLKMEK